MLARFGFNEQQVGDIGGGNEHDQTDGAHDHP